MGPWRYCRSAARQRLDVGLTLVVVEIRVLDGGPAVRFDTDLVDDPDAARPSDPDAACSIVAARRPEWGEQDARNRNEQCETRGGTLRRMHGKGLSVH